MSEKTIQLSWLHWQVVPGWPPHPVHPDVVLPRRCKTQTVMVTLLHIVSNSLLIVLLGAFIRLKGIWSTLQLIDFVLSFGPYPYYIYTGGSRLKLDFLGAWKSVRLKHYLAYPIIIISLIIQRNLATKIWAKWESGLTAVWLKRDPPVEDC